MTKLHNYSSNVLAFIPGLWQLFTEQKSQGCPHRDGRSSSHSRSSGKLFLTENAFFSIAFALSAMKFALTLFHLHSFLFSILCPPVSYVLMIIVCALVVAAFVAALTPNPFHS
jgi:hypothetical protein